MVQRIILMSGPIGSGKSTISSAMDDKFSIPIFSTNRALRTVAGRSGRDLTNSSFERIVIPESFTLTHYIIVVTRKLLSAMFVDTLKMLTNLKDAGSEIFSGMLLDHLVRNGLDRPIAYQLIQSAKQNSSDSAADFVERLLELPEIQAVTTQKDLCPIISHEGLIDAIDSVFQRSGVNDK